MWLISVEAKGRREDLHQPQVLRAAQAFARSHGVPNIAGVIPFAIKIVGPSLIYTVEFDPVDKTDTVLTLAAEGVIQLVPDVKGIS